MGGRNNDPLALAKRIDVFRHRLLMCRQSVFSSTRFVRDRHAAQRVPADTRVMVSPVLVPPASLQQHFHKRRDALLYYAFVVQPHVGHVCFDDKGRQAEFVA